nr:hypothetical protein [Tanacetum cinerariifolium]
MEAFREMLHISHRVPGQSFDELPFKEEILAFLRFLGHSTQIKTLTDVVSRHQNTQQYGVILPIELTTEDIRNTKAYKEYYACATREAAPKQKASARRKRIDSNTPITPPNATPTPITTIAGAPRLTAAAKGKQPAKAKSPYDPLEDDDDDDQDDAERDDDDDDNDDEEEIAKIDELEDIESGGGDAEEIESDEESAEEKTREKEEESFDLILRTPEDSEDDGNGEEDQGLRVSEEKRLIEEEETDELYRDQESSLVSSFVTSMLSPISDAGVESIFTTASSSVAPLPTPIPTMTPSIITTITTASYPSIPPTPIPSEVLQNLPTFDSVFRFNERLKSLEASFSKYSQTNPFAEAVLNIPENDEFLKTIDDNMKRIIKEQVKSQVNDQVSRILPRIEQSVNAQLEYEVLTRSSHSSRTSYAVAVDLKEMELKKIIIEKMEGNKSIQRSDEQRNQYKALVDAYEADKTILKSYGDTAILKRRRGMMMIRKDPPLDQTRGQRDEEKVGSLNQLALHQNQQPRVQAGLQQGLNLDRCQPVSLLMQRNLCRLPVRWTNPHIQCLKQQADSRSSFNELLDTPIDFSNFIMNRLCVDTLTPELLAGPTYELMRGSCNSLTELEYHLGEVYKATTDQLDWVNPKGQQYLHNLLQPLPLIPDNRGRRVIPFAHFINNDLKYLRGDLVPRTMWIQEPLNYDKHALWGVSHWGQKRQQFYGFAVNRESALDVYSKRRIVAVTDLKIVKWHNYKHLDWISVRRDDDKIYKFKEGDFKRLRLQDIEDMLLLLVQGKLSNLTVDERFAFNVSLRMFTRSIVIQRRVEDLQLGVESYHNRLNLTKPDTYRSDLK